MNLLQLSGAVGLEGLCSWSAVLVLCWQPGKKAPHLSCDLAESSAMNVLVGVEFYVWWFVDNL